MLTIILRRNPITGTVVPRSAANVLRALVEFIPGGELITQALDNYGIFDRVGQWVEEQINSLGMTADAIRTAVTAFISSLSPMDLLHLGGLWDRALRIFTTPIDRLISFGRRVATGIVGLIKDAILQPLARLASQTRGWNLLIAVLGRNPITGESVPRNAETLIGGFMRLIGQEEVWTNIQRARAVPRAWAWFQGALESLISLVRDVPSRFVSELRQLEVIDIVILPRAFMRIGRVFVGFLGSFLSWAGNQVLSLLQIIFEVVAPRAMPYVRRAGGALETIFRNPGGFARNLVRAGVQGFRQFKDNFLNHLRRSLIEWLTGAMSGAGLYIPQAFNFREIVKFVLSVLGLTWQNLRAKLVRAIGATAVSVLETTFDVVVTLVREGPAAAWERIRESISNLREMVTGQIMNLVRERIVVAAITMLVSSLVPGAGFIRAIMSIYDTVMFFVDRARQIATVVGAYIDSIAAIASGNIGTAANRVETTMARTLTVVISFLASVLRFGRVTDAVAGILNRLRQPIDQALDRVVAWIRERAQSLLQRAAGGTPEQRLQRALTAGQSAVNRFAGRRVGVIVLRPLLNLIRMRYQLQTLEAVARGGRWVVRGVVNPEGERPTNAQVEQPSSGNVKQRAGEEVRRRFQQVTRGVQARSIVREVFNRYRSEGLLSLEIIRDRNRPGEFNVDAEASAKTRTKVRAILGISLSDLELRRPSTALNATLQVGSTSKPLGTHRSGNTKHAEERLLIKLTAEWSTLANAAHHNLIVININRSPCGVEPGAHNCAGRLDRFVDAKRAAGYDTNLRLNMVSLYGGVENRPSVLALEFLAGRGYTLTVWNVIQVLVHRSIILNNSDLSASDRERLRSMIDDLETELESIEGVIR